MWEKKNPVDWNTRDRYVRREGPVDVEVVESSHGGWYAHVRVDCQVLFTHRALGARELAPALLAAVECVRDEKDRWARASACSPSVQRERRKWVDKLQQWLDAATVTR